MNTSESTLRRLPTLWAFGLGLSVIFGTTVFVKGKNHGFLQWRNLQLTHVTLKNLSAKTGAGVQLKWFITTRTERDKILPPPAYTGLFEAHLLSGETAKVESPLVKFSRAVKHLVKEGNLEGDFLLHVRVFQVEFEDGSVWNDDWNGPKPGDSDELRNTQSHEKVRRLSLERSKVVMQSPPTYSHRARTDAKTGVERPFDPKPQVEVVDAKAGKYALKWIGYDGKEKIVYYQRADAIDVVVAASVSRDADGNYLYTYEVQNLSSSSTSLSHYILQNFAADSRPFEIDGKRTNNQDLRGLNAFRKLPPDGTARNLEDMAIGQMSDFIPPFKNGTWISFAPLPAFTPPIAPGRTLTVKLLSSAPPGLVGCRVTGGDLTLKGAGEHMPSELEAVIPGYDEFPIGTTIGPVTDLKSLSTRASLSRIREQLPLFEKLGWMTSSARNWYDNKLHMQDWGLVLEQAQADLKAERITTEVLAILQGVKDSP